MFGPLRLHLGLPKGPVGRVLPVTLLALLFLLTGAEGWTQTCRP